MPAYCGAGTFSLRYVQTRGWTNVSSSDEISILFLAVALGAVLGKFSWRGLSLGTSAVIFVALFFGHLGYTIPDNVGLLGLTVFVFCLGINAGPSFFRLFCEQASSLAMMGAAMISAAVAGTWAFAKLFEIPADLAAGMFAGALTSTPALAAAAESLPADSQVAVGFGLAYPFGAVGVVLFVQLASKHLGKHTHEPNVHTYEENVSRITRRVVEVANPGVVDKTLSELAILDKCSCQISRARIDNEMTPISGSFQLQMGQQLLVIGAEREIDLVVDFLGKVSPSTEYVLDVERQRRRIVVTADSVVGRTLGELNLATRFGVTISRITRHDVEFVPDVNQAIQFGDALTVIGQPEGLDQFVTFAGHRERSFDETDMISMAVGLLLGVLLGQLRLQFGEHSFSLGMAGGPLVVGLTLGHFGRIGPIVGHFPRAARMLLTETGLALFLASAGVQAGGQLVDVIQQHGVGICFGAILVTGIPLLVGGLLTHYSLRMGSLRSLGGICGAMTSTPGLGALTSKIDSCVPVASYAAVYPIALILMSLLAPMLVSVIS